MERAIATTNRQLLKSIRNHRGKVEVPVLYREGISYIFAEKSDLIRAIKDFGGPDELAPWYVVGVLNGYLRLDVQHKP